MFYDLLKDKLSLPPVEAGFSRIELFASSGARAILCQCEFDAEQCNIILASKLNIMVPDSIKVSVKKRQAEFIAGRYMAKLCLEALSVVDHNVLIGSHREPLWPEGIIGAISHTCDRVVALVADKIDYRFAGLDVENWLDAETVELTGSDIHSNSEFNLLRDQGVNSIMASSIIFSAKESLFKATFPYIGYYFWFESARVIEFDQCQGTLLLELDKTLAQHCLGESFFKCRYFIEESSVTTMILC
ncbi:4'-phosphopantetheinyl transferase family protein [Pantoea stewartii]|uniref:4'-phosphopantetheinyl transferase family protein n=1 Tax=Pantoea stewartii TaxID=66269 RepID=UPI00198056D9|nr:4'-phosphopantetheinyl transferase superfamily protein [Pantoea stewartii]